MITYKYFIGEYFSRLFWSRPLGAVEDAIPAPQSMRGVLTQLFVFVSHDRVWTTSVRADKVLKPRRWTQRYMRHCYSDCKIYLDFINTRGETLQDTEDGNSLRF